MATHYYSDMVDRKTCVYRAFIGDRLAYVGLTLNPKGRFSAHSRKPWWREVTRVDLEWFDGREAAKEAERAAIRDESPLYNIYRPKVAV